MRVIFELHLRSARLRDHASISFPDLMRDQLWGTFGDEITAMIQEARAEQPNERQIVLDFNNETDF